MKPERHIWDEDSTHRAVAGKEYDEVWDYAEQLKAENEALRAFLRQIKAMMRERYQPHVIEQRIDALLTGEQDA